MTGTPRDSGNKIKISGGGDTIDLADYTDRLCREAVRVHRALDNLDTSPASARLTWIGELVGLRIALCLAHGWDSQAEADKEGKADELIVAWWEKNFPKEWEFPS